MKVPAPRNISQRIVYRYSALTVTCFVSAMLQALAVGLTVALATSFKHEQFGLARLLWFVPTHEFLWRAWCVAHCLSTLGLLLIAVNWSQLVARRFRETALFSTLLIAMSSYAAIDAYLMMMTQFSDLARDANYNFSINQLGTMQLSSVTVTQFLTRLTLLSNSLECTAGIILSICGFLTPKFPRSVAWTGLIVWLVAINATITAACGEADLAVKVYYGSRALMVALFATFGAVCTLRAADKSTGSPKVFLNKDSMAVTEAAPAAPDQLKNAAAAATSETSAPVAEGEPAHADVDATTATDWRVT